MVLSVSHQWRRVLQEMECDRYFGMKCKIKILFTNKLISTPHNVHNAKCFFLVYFMTVNQLHMSHSHVTWNKFLHHRKLLHTVIKPKRKTNLWHVAFQMSHSCCSGALFYLNDHCTDKKILHLMEQSCPIHPLEINIFLLFNNIIHCSVLI